MPWHSRHTGRSCCEAIADLGRRWPTNARARTCLCVYVLACVRACVRACVCACVRARVLACVHVRAFACAAQPTLLLAKHARGMERLLSALHASVAQFESVQQRLGSLHASVWARYAESSQQTAAESSARPTWTVVGAGQGQAAQHVLIPSTMQLLGWLGELDAMLCDDILVKHQLMEVLSFDVDPERLSQLVRVWSQAAHVRQEPLQRLQALAASLTLDS
eukprot:2488817-Pleurochrysis_carterae.AAC.1